MAEKSIERNGFLPDGPPGSRSFKERRQDRISSAAERSARVHDALHPLVARRGVVSAHDHKPERVYGGRPSR